MLFFLTWFKECGWANKILLKLNLEINTNKSKGYTCTSRWISWTHEQVEHFHYFCPRGVKIPILIDRIFAKSSYFSECFEMVQRLKSELLQWCLDSVLT